MLNTNAQILREAVYFLLLTLCVVLQADNYNYLVKYSHPSLYKIAFAAMSVVFYCLVLKVRVGVFESIFLLCFRLASVYPILIFYLFYSEMVEPLLFSVLFYVTLHVALKLKFFEKLPVNRVLSKDVVLVFFLIVILVLFGLLVSNNGLPSLSALNLLKIYDVRSEFNSSRIIAVAQSFAAFFVVPYLIFHANSFRGITIPFAISLAIFLFSGGKFVFAIFLVFIALRLLLSFRDLRYLILIFLLPISGAFLLILVGDDFFPHFLFFRPFITPAWVSYEYFKFVEEYGFFYYSEHFFNGLFVNALHLPTAVGWQMYPQSGTYANAGSIAYSFANTGWLFFIEITFIVLTVKGFAMIGGSARYGRDRLFVMALLALLGIYLGTTSILSALKTRVFIMSLVTLFFVVKRRS